MHRAVSCVPGPGKETMQTSLGTFINHKTRWMPDEAVAFEKRLDCFGMMPKSDHRQAGLLDHIVLPCKVTAALICERVAQNDHVMILPVIGQFSVFREVSLEDFLRNIVPVIRLLEVADPCEIAIQRV